MEANSPFVNITPLNPDDILLLRPIGEGAFGVVSEAFHTPTKLRLAVKCVDLAKLEQKNEQ
jgi:serine/threonine protein kinase